jgi:hypothetical protein
MKGDNTFNIQFLPAFMNYWQQGIAAGRTPAELADRTQVGWISPSAPPSAATAYLRANPNLRTAFRSEIWRGCRGQGVGRGWASAANSDARDWPVDAAMSTLCGPVQGAIRD